MLYVDEKGKLLDTEGKIKIKSKFFVNSTKFNYSSVSLLIGHFGILYKALNDLLESTYKINLGRISRTEKNKGRDYPSSAFTVTAGLEYIMKTQEEMSKDLETLIPHLFTLKGSSKSSLDIITKNNKEFIMGYLKYHEGLRDIYSKDQALYQYIQRERDTPYLINYMPIVVHGLRGTKFELDVMDQVTYLGHMTKFMEMMGNYMIPSEIPYYPDIYENWLFHIFKKYFKYSFLEIYRK